MAWIEGYWGALCYGYGLLLVLVEFLIPALWRVRLEFTVWPSIAVLFGVEEEDEAPQIEEMVRRFHQQKYQLLEQLEELQQSFEQLQDTKQRIEQQELLQQQQQLEQPKDAAQPVVPSRAPPRPAPLPREQQRPFVEPAIALEKPRLPPLRPPLAPPSATRNRRQREWGVYNGTRDRQASQEQTRMSQVQQQIHPPEELETKMDSTTRHSSRRRKRQSTEREAVQQTRADPLARKLLFEDEDDEDEAEDMESFSRRKTGLVRSASAAFQSTAPAARSKPVYRSSTSSAGFFGSNQLDTTQSHQEDILSSPRDREKENEKSAHNAKEGTRDGRRYVSYGWPSAKKRRLENEEPPCEQASRLSRNGW